VSDSEIKIELLSMEPEDRSSVLQLFEEFIRHEAGLDPSQTPFVQDRTNDPVEAENYLSYCEHHIEQCGGSLVIAKYQEQVVGFLCWSVGTDGPYVRPEFRTVGEILFVMAGERYRGLGIGSSLVREAERLTKAAGLNRLSLMVMAGNKRAVGLYERMGFQCRAYKMLRRL
jgi:ribosomal protein S18 acetylase RimI-like enzyme